MRNQLAALSGLCCLAHAPSPESPRSKDGNSVATYLGMSERMQQTHPAHETHAHPFVCACMHALHVHQELVGKALKKFGRERFVLATKFGILPDGKFTGSGTPETVHSQLAESLKRLDTDYIDLYYQVRAYVSVTHAYQCVDVCSMPCACVCMPLDDHMPHAEAP